MEYMKSIVALTVIVAVVMTLFSVTVYNRMNETTVDVETIDLCHEYCQLKGLSGLGAIDPINNEGKCLCSDGNIFDFFMIGE